MIQLRPDQEPAVEAIEYADCGIIKAPAGAGKTVMGAVAAFRRQGNFGRSLNIIIVANTLEQCEQWENAAQAVGLRGSAERLDIVCYQTGKSCVGYDLAIFDECHHIASPEFRKILDGFKGIRWGFSATPDRADDLKDDVYELLGPIVYEVPREELVSTGKLAPAKVIFLSPNEPDELEQAIEADAAIRAKKMDGAVSFTAVKMQNKSIEQVARLLGKEVMQKAAIMAESYELEVEGTMKSLLQATHTVPASRNNQQHMHNAATIRKWLTEAAKKELLSRARWHACQEIGITENEKRNADIVLKVGEHLSDSVLILVGSIEHGQELCRMINEHVAPSSPNHSAVLHSKMGAKKRRDAMEAFRNGTLKCAIATSLADEGLDVPRANVLILAAAGRSEAKAEQRTGRVLRAWGEKSHGTIYDFWDWHHPLLLNQARARAKVYMGLNYEFVGDERTLPSVLKAIGVRVHPAVGMEPRTRREKNLGGQGERRIIPTDREDNKPVVKEAPDDPKEMRGFESSGPTTTAQSAQNNLPVPAQPVVAQCLGEARATLVPGSRVGASDGQKLSEDSGCINLTDERSSATSEPAMPITSNLTEEETKAGCINPPAVPQNTILLAGEKLMAYGAHIEQTMGSVPEGVVMTSPPLAHTERKHARLSPSTLKGKAICSGFISDPDGDKTASTRGTLGHEAVEKENPDLCGDDERLRHAVESCIAYKRKVIGDKGYIQEIRLDYFDQWGFCDLLVFGGDVADLVDWKFAYNEHPAYGPQFQAYCLGIWNKYPHFKKIRVHTVHPFLNVIDIEEYTREGHYEQFTLDLLAIIAKANLNRPEDYRITDQCRYCGLAGKCWKLANAGLTIGKKYAPDIELPTDTNFHGTEVTDPTLMASLYTLKPIMEKAAKGWSKAALEMYDNGTDIPGFQLRTKGGKRSVTSAAAAYKIIKQHFAPAMTEDQFLKHCDVTVTGLEELVSDASPKGMKGKNCELLQAHLEDEDALTVGGEGRFLARTKEPILDNE